jgi:hypothetical protein
MTDRPSTTTEHDTRAAARQEKEQVKGTAKDAASNVGDAASRRGRQLQGEAKGHARDLARNAQHQLRGHAQEETQRAGSALSTAGDQLRALADGRIDDAGVFGDYVEQAADAVNRWADTINDRGFDGLLDDLRSVGRRRPGMFLGGALLAGVLAGRFGRNVAQELRDDQPALPSDTSTTSAASSTAGGRTYSADEPVGGGTEPYSADEPVGGTQPYADEPVGGGTKPFAGGPDPAATPGTTPGDIDEVRPTGRSTGDERLTEEGGPADRTDEMIVGYASDDRGVVVDPAGRTSDQVSSGRPVAPPDDIAEDDLEHRPIDVDRERRR